jgi:hypothetical protein
MPDEPASPNLPVRLPPNTEARVGALMAIDRAALERVLARAAELQATTADDGTPSDGLTEQQLLEVGGEVGLSPVHLRLALAEERTRNTVPSERGLVAQMAGAAAATAQRMVRGTPSEVLGALNQTMQRDESLIVRRRYADRVTWEPRRDFWAALRRLSVASGRAYDLLRVSEVAATAVAVDDSRTLVRLDADVSGTRGRRLQGGVAVASAGTVAGGIVFGLAMLIQPALIAALAVGAVPAIAGLVGGVAVARTHRQIVQRAQLALEQVLDRLEHNELRRPASILDVLVR